MSANRFWLAKAEANNKEHAARKGGFFMWAFQRSRTGQRHD
jgi:hypothetical protein